MRIRPIFVVVVSLFLAASLVAQTKAVTGTPQYKIFDIGFVQSGDTAAQAFRISPNNVAVGRSLRSGGAQAFTWSLNGGIVGLPNLSGFPYCVANSERLRRNGRRLRRRPFLVRAVFLWFGRMASQHNSRCLPASPSVTRME